MLHRSALAFVLAVTAAMPVVAQELAPCEDGMASAEYLAEPWSETSATFANGDVRLAVLDYGEPAVGGFHLLVLSPPYDDGGFRQCRLLTFEAFQGFGDIDVTRIGADYDPDIGLILSIPIAAHYGGEGMVNRILGMTLNQSDGKITFWLE